MQATHCWQVDGAWRVGTSLSIARAKTDFRKDLASTCGDYDVRLMQHYHDPTKIEAVPVAWLRPYSETGIETP